MSSIFPDPSRYPSLEVLPLVDTCLQAPSHHCYSVSSSDYVTAYDCSSINSVCLDHDSCLSDLMKEIKEFYDEFGYVVLQGVFNSEQCARTRDAMWEILEDANPGMKRDDQESWNALKSKGFA